jgi:hypothetical protein
MMQIQERTPHHIGLVATGTLGEQDYFTLARAIGEAGPELNVVLDFTDADSVDGSGAMKALKKVMSEHDKITVDRVAFIGEQKWIDWAARAVSPIVSADVQAFHVEPNARAAANAREDNPAKLDAAEANARSRS